MKKNIISLIILVLAIVVIFFFVIPKWDSCASFRDRAIEEEAELDRLKAWAEKIDELKKEYQNLESEIQKVFLALPEEEDIPNLMVQFEALASESNLILESISFGQITDMGKSAENELAATGAMIMSSDMEVGIQQPGSESPRGSDSSLRELKVDIGISGSYNNFKNYLNSLSKNMRSMDVEFISLSGKTSSGEESAGKIIDLYNFKLSIIVYYR